VPSSNLTILTLFVAAVLSVAIILAAFVAALVISQRRRLAQEHAHAQRLLAAQEEERSRVARELHDDALQRIAMIRNNVDEVAAASPDARHRLGGVSEELEDLSTVLRTAARHLHPSVVEKAGLVRALQELAEEFARTGPLDVRMVLPGPVPPVRTETGVAVYRIAQEALRNVVRHAGVGEAEMSLEVDGATGALRLGVSDAGRGFATGASRPEDGLGLIAMRQRAVGAGGRLTLRASPGGGTVVTAVFARGWAS
jgi:signal transduction histidine kinase